MPTRVTTENAVARTGRETCEFSSWFAVVRAYEECGRRYAQMLEHFDLTISQFDALVAIEALGAGAQPKAVAERLLVTRANVTGLLRRLEERELITLTPHESDGRSLRCTLTAHGRKLTARAKTAAQRFVQAQLAPFSTAELETTEAQMRALYTHLQTLDPAVLAKPEAKPRRAVAKLRKTVSR